MARAQLGTMERTGRNDVIYADYYGITGYSWCYAFTQWCFEQLKSNLPFLTMYVPAGVAWSRNNGQSVEKDNPPQPGDVVHFTWGDGWGVWTPGTGDHVGIVEGYEGADTIVTIEGNVGSPQGVYRMRRSINAVVINYWRPKGVYSDGGTTGPTQEDDMTPEEHQMLVDTTARALYVQQLAQENANRTLYLQQLAQHNQNNVDTARAEASQLHTDTRGVVTTSADAVMQNSAKLAAGISVGGGTVEVPVIDVPGSLKKASITDLLNEISARTKGQAV